MFYQALKRNMQKQWCEVLVISHEFVRMDKKNSCTKSSKISSNLANWSHMVKLDGERDPNKCSYKQDYYKDQEGKCVFQIQKKKKMHTTHK